jgi:hypothetical protein
MPINLSNNVINAKMIEQKGAIITKIPSDGLIVHLDAGNTNSYPGSGSVWYDLSARGNNFNINASAFVSSGVKYMDFNGSYGCAKNSSDLSLSDGTGVTYLLWTRIKQSTGEWRTLTRSYSSDHHVIIQSGGYEIGMYDNDSVGFLSTGQSQTSLPGWNTGQWQMLSFRWSNSSPEYYVYSPNATTYLGGYYANISNSNARYNRGFGSIGCYHNGSTDVNTSSQYWGDVSMFLCYNRYLTGYEVDSFYRMTKSRYGL